MHLLYNACPALLPLPVFFLLRATFAARKSVFVAVVPSSLLASLQGVKGFDREAFEAVHAVAEPVTSIRINPAKVPLVNGERGMANGAGFPFHHSPPIIHQPVPWSSYGFYLAQRPSFTFDPFFHAGCYYVQEASSMFLEQALKQTASLVQPLRVLDLCAAPGGKSTHLQSLLSADSLLVSNEVIKSRAGVLRQNIVKWGSSNVVVTSNDPQHFARLQSFFDVLVVDAPCSGSGLFRRDAAAISEWSEEAVQLCCGRQKRILADALPCLKEGGVLIYSTCSYSKKEDEDIADWLTNEQGLHNEKLTIPAEWGIVETQAAQSGAYGYRFFPDKVKGEGFYLAVFRKTAGAGAARWKTAKPERAGSREKAVAQSWLRQNDLEIFKEGFLYALPAALAEPYAVIKANLYVQYAGVQLGEIMKEKLVPDHALALSLLPVSSIPKVQVNYEEAIRYLQKADVPFAAAEKGWNLVVYAGHNLGWINALHNRVNNYYPKEYRILKQQEGNSFEK